MHVGDSMRLDVQGAKAIGVFAVWLNGSGLPRPSDIEPDFEIGTLLALNPLLAMR